MGVILDTSIWVDVERGRLSPADVASVTGAEPVYLAPPVIAELQYGVERAPDAAARARRKPCLILDRETGECFGRLAAHLDAGGAPLAPPRKQSLAGGAGHPTWLAAGHAERERLLGYSRSRRGSHPSSTARVVPSTLFFPRVHVNQREGKAHGILWVGATRARRPG